MLRIGRLAIRRVQVRMVVTRAPRLIMQPALAIVAALAIALQIRRIERCTARATAQLVIDVVRRPATAWGGADRMS